MKRKVDTKTHTEIKEKEKNGWQGAQRMKNIHMKQLFMISLQCDCDHI